MISLIKTVIQHLMLVKYVGLNTPLDQMYHDHSSMPNQWMQTGEAENIQKN